MRNRDGGQKPQIKVGSTVTVPHGCSGWGTVRRLQRASDVTSSRRGGLRAFVEWPDGHTTWESVRGLRNWDDDDDDEQSGWSWLQGEPTTGRFR